MKNELVTIVTAAKNGDVNALNELFNLYYKDIYYFALKTVKDENLAYDITQESFIEIINTIGNLNEPAAFVSWSKKITYHQCTRYFKKKQAVIVDEDEDGATIFDELQEENSEFIPDEALDNDEFKKTIMSMLDELSEEQRSATMMYYFDELSVKQIAEIQNVSEGTVKSRLNYARKSIKSSVDTYEKKHGIKLHTIALLPLLKWVFDGFFNDSISVASANGIAEGVSAATGAPIINTVNSAGNPICTSANSLGTMETAAFSNGTIETSAFTGEQMETVTFNSAENTIATAPNTSAGINATNPATSSGTYIPTETTTANISAGASNGSAAAAAACTTAETTTASAVATAAEVTATATKTAGLGAKIAALPLATKIITGAIAGTMLVSGTVAAIVISKDSDEHKNPTTNKSSIATPLYNDDETDLMNVFRNDKNTAYEADTISVKPKYVYWENGKLVAECFVINGYQHAVYDINIEKLSFSNQDVEIANAGFGVLQNLTLKPYAYQVWTFTFLESTIINYGADLSFLHTEVSVSNYYQNSTPNDNSVSAAEEEYYKSLIADFVPGSNNTFSIAIGHNDKPSASIWLNSGNGKVYISDKNVVTCSKYGTVTAVGTGSAYIVISSGTLYEVYRYDVHVATPEDESNTSPEADGIDFATEIAGFQSSSLNTKTLLVGEADSPTAALWAQSGGRCYTSDASVVTIDARGIVTARSPGTAYIIIRSGMGMYEMYKYNVTE